MPIPLNFLPHTIDLYKKIGDDRWGEKYIEEPIIIENVRLEHSTKLMKDKTGLEIQLKGILYFDNVNSKPKDAIFNVNDKIKFNGNEYTVKLIRPIVAIKPHHLEIGLV